MSVIRMMGIVLFCCFFSMATQANIHIYHFDSPQQEQQFYHLTQELRCPKCQNQSIADSDAMVAQDIKSQVYQWVIAGKTNQWITHQLTDRYGDFIHYRPALTSATAILWVAPPVLLVFIISLIVWIIRRRNRVEETQS